MKIEKRKIIEIKRANGSNQYLMTIPKEYAVNLKNQGINTLLIVYDYGIGLFPKDDLAEDSLLLLLSKHKDIRKIFAKPIKQPVKVENTNIEVLSQ